MTQQFTGDLKMTDTSDTPGIGRYSNCAEKPKQHDGRYDAKEFFDELKIQGLMIVQRQKPPRHIPLFQTIMLTLGLIGGMALGSFGITYAILLFGAPS